MSHIKQNAARKNKSLRILLIGSLFIALFGFIDVFASAAHAATNKGRTHSANPSYVLKSNLADLSHSDTAILDWHTQSYEITFNMPAHDWYENLDLFLSALPEGNVSRRTPLLISYNGAAPIALNGKGAQFDAHIRLDPSRIRINHNTIKITYQTPSDADCLTSAHGKWVLDLSRSKLVVKARAKGRKFHISDVEPRLTHPMTAPKRVALIAKGTQKFALEAILAQGIAQRTHDLPNFKFTPANADFTVLIGTNKQIRSLVKNKNHLDANRPSIFMDASIKPKLVLSAPNEAQVMELARAFSTFHLPVTHSADISIFDLYSGQKLQSKPTLSNDTYRVSEIGDVSFTPSWHTQAARINFNVQDAHASSGLLTLDIATQTNPNSKSRLDVQLNGHSLGYTLLNKAQKRVSFDIADGHFKPANNMLTITPKFTNADTGNACIAQQAMPTVLVSKASKFTIEKTRATPRMDLSHLAANGLPFHPSTDSLTMVLTAKSAKDRAATLQFLGFAAQQFGPQWVDAHYVTQLPKDENLDDNIFMIGPGIALNSALSTTAPQGLKLALKGRALTGPSTIKIASLERHASLDGAKSFQIAARSLNAQSRIKSGGVAAIFPSPYTDGKFIGVITTTYGANFENTLRTLTHMTHWNALQGSVTRWNNTSVLMAQISTPLAGEILDTKPKQSIPQYFANMKTKTLAWFSNISFPKKQIKHARSHHLDTDMVTTSTRLPKLRGAIQVLPTPDLNSHVRSIHVDAFQRPIFPKFANIKSDVQSQFSALRISFADAKYNVMPAAISKHKLLDTIKHNRLMWLFLLAGLGYFLIGFASPKSAGPK